MFLDGGRHPAVLRLKMGAQKDGTLTAMDMWVADGIGAYGPIPDICFLMSGFLISKYRCPNKRFDGRTVYTNTPPLSAMRGAGNPQVHFAVESQMDILAEKLGIDPVDLRLKNNPRDGDEFIGQGPEIRCIIKSCGLEEITKEGARRIGWEDRKSTIPYKDRPWIRRGVGMASGFHTTGCGSSEPNTYMLDFSGAIVKMNEDGTACLTLAAADFGSGNITSIAAIVAEELGIHYEDVIVTKADTENSLYEHWVHASRSVYSIGSAAKAASLNAKQVILDWASMVLEVPSEQLDIKNRRVFFIKDPSVETGIREVLEYAQSQFLGTAIGTASHRATACPPHFVSTFVEVDVDTKTGEVKIVRVFHGADVGTPINPGIVRGQLIGGLHMGLGYALTENVVYDPGDGHVLNPNFRDYKLLTPLDMPEVETFLADTYEPTGPFGAKGVGEGSTNTVAPAVYNAVYNAVGARILTMPLTPEKVLRALQEKESSNG
jgi:CO/xanthine dehydrogenase Mo-binding subunit